MSGAGGDFFRPYSPAAAVGRLGTHHRNRGKKRKGPFPKTECPKPPAALFLGLRSLNMEKAGGGMGVKRGSAACDGK